MLNIRCRNLLLWSAVVGLGLQSCVKDELLVTEPEANPEPGEETITALNELEVPGDFMFETSREVTVKMTNLNLYTKYNVYWATDYQNNSSTTDPTTLSNKVISSFAMDNSLERSISVPAYIQELIVEEENLGHSKFKTILISGNEAQYSVSDSSAKAVSFLKSTFSNCANGPDNDGDGICDDVDTDDDNDGIPDDTEMLRAQFFSTLADQVITAPANAVAIEFKIWGAGGGGGSYNGSFAPGGSGGYVAGLIPTAPGQQYTLVVGEGGLTDGNHGVNHTSYGFGGNGSPTGDGDGADGGGLSGIFTGNTQVLNTDQARAVAIAGGGGAGEVASWAGDGGAVRYATGGQGGDTTHAGGSGTMTGGSDTADTTPGSGGGGGYFGGAAESTRLSSGAGLPHGEGGSNFKSAYLISGISLHTTDLAGANQFATEVVLPPMNTDPDYVSGVGYGTSVNNTKAGDGMIVIRYILDSDGDDIPDHLDDFNGIAPLADNKVSADASALFNTGVTGSVNTNDSGWTVELVQGPDTWYAPAAGGEIAAVISGKLAGSWVDEPANSQWISYLFTGGNNGLGNHTDGDGDGNINESVTTQSGANGDWVALNFKKSVNLPNGGLDYGVSLDLAVDNYVTSIKVNGVEQSIKNIYHLSELKRVVLDSDWVQGLNTLEIEIISGPSLVGLLVTNATETYIGDSDNDGVNDLYDEYPNDVTKAFNSYYPSSDSWASVAFEDLWPFAGDYDFNDLVTEYRIVTVTNASNEVVGVDYVVNNISNGGSFRNALAIRLPGVSPSVIGSVSGALLTESLVSVSGNGTEAGQTDAVIFLTDNTQLYEGQGFTVTVTLSSPSASFNSGSFDPFLVVNQERVMEVHLPGYSSTDLGDNTPTVEGASNEDADGDYQTSNGMPWAINVAGSYAPPTEKTPVNEAYTYFNNWATSGGTTKPDWYLDLAGHRVSSKIKQ